MRNVLLSTSGFVVAVIGAWIVFGAGWTLFGAGVVLLTTGGLASAREEARADLAARGGRRA